jgi:hypothetical protein
MDADALLALAKGDQQVKKLLAGKTIAKEIAIPGRLVNFVVRTDSRFAAGLSSSVKRTPRHNSGR